jgi:hypothetical protein
MAKRSIGAVVPPTRPTRIHKACQNLEICSEKLILLRNMSFESETCGLKNWSWLRRMKPNWGGYCHKWPNGQLEQWCYQPRPIWIRKTYPNLETCAEKFILLRNMSFKSETCAVKKLEFGCAEWNPSEADIIVNGQTVNWSSCAANIGQLEYVKLVKIWKPVQKNWLF